MSTASSPGAHPMVQPLEQRRYLYYTIADGYLSFNGSPSCDAVCIEVPDEGNAIIVNINGRPNWTDMTGIVGIRAFMRGGDDRLDLSKSPVPVTITSGGGNDTIIGSAFDDELNGGSGDDSIPAGDGDDSVIGSSGVDVISGGGGNDTIFGGAQGDMLEGGDGDDSILGGSFADLIRGGPGNDLLRGAGGSDTIYGDDGGDTLYGDADDDLLYTRDDAPDFLRGGSTGADRAQLDAAGLDQYRDIDEILA